MGRCYGAQDEADALISRRKSSKDKHNLYMQMYRKRPGYKLRHKLYMRRYRKKNKGT